MIVGWLFYYKFSFFYCFDAISAFAYFFYERAVTGRVECWVHNNNNYCSHKKKKNKKEKKNETHTHNSHELFFFVFHYLFSFAMMTIYLNFLSVWAFFFRSLFSVRAVLIGITSWGIVENIYLEGLDMQIKRQCGKL